MTMVLPQLIDREQLFALSGSLPGGKTRDVRIEIFATLRLNMSVLQLLLAAQRDGVRLHVEDLGDGLAETLRALGITKALPADGAAP